MRDWSMWISGESSRSRREQIQKPYSGSKIGVGETVKKPGELAWNKPGENGKRWG